MNDTQETLRQTGELIWNYINPSGVEMQLRADIDRDGAYLQLYRRDTDPQELVREWPTTPETLARDFAIQRTGLYLAMI